MQSVYESVFYMSIFLTAINLNLKMRLKITFSLFSFLFGHTEQNIKHHLRVVLEFLAAEAQSNRQQYGVKQGNTKDDIIISLYVEFL